MSTVLAGAAGKVVNSTHTLETFAEFATACGHTLPPTAVT